MIMPFRYVSARTIKIVAWIAHASSRLAILICLAGFRLRNYDVVLGCNFPRSGGVHNHIHAIKRYSKLKIELFPSEKLMSRFSESEFTGKYNSHFQYFKPSLRTVVHSHGYPWFIEWCRKQQSIGIPWVHTYHLLYFPEHKRPGYDGWHSHVNRSLTEVARFADVKISVSKWQQDFLREKYSIDSIYIPNGVDVQRCDKGNAESFVREIGHRQFILHVSRHDPVKNPREFVRLAQEMPEFLFVMIGLKLSADVLRTDYDIVAPANLIIYGPATNSKVQDAIAACTVLVSTSLREGLPTLVLEGMTHSKAVVVSNEPGSMEAIHHGEFGYYYSLGDLSDLKAKTYLALRDGTIGKKARDRVLAEYDWRVVAAKLDSLYSTLRHKNP